jgi:succinate-semialdehyde dehydrogenase/glutarate-semialdehyde dehydrogenase
MELQYEVLDPRTGESLRSFPLATAEEVAQAIESAARAHRDWSQTSPAERAAVVRRVGELHKERADELARSTPATSTCTTPITPRSSWPTSRSR